jgi:1,2-diacylglycerol 3-beta-galactosyltransferase
VAQEIEETVDQIVVLTKPASFRAVAQVTQKTGIVYPMQGCSQSWKSGAYYQGGGIVLKTKEILILTGDAGLGHRSAAEAIAAALEERYGDDCAVEVANPLNDERVPAALREGQSGYDRVIQELPGLYEFGYEATDAAAPASMLEAVLTVMLFSVVRDLVRHHDPDVILSTFPLLQAPVGAVRLIEGRHIPLITVITDLTTNHRIWFHQASDLVVVPTEEAHQLALDYGFSPEAVKVIGIPVDPALAEKGLDPTTVRSQLGWDPDLKTVLAVGSQRVRNLPEALRGLNHAGLPVQLVIVAGGNDSLYQELQDTEWHATMHLYNFVDDLPRFMRASDCILCKAGGLIVTEALASGLPLLLMDVLPGQETGNAEYVVEHGAGEEAAGPISVLETVYHWLDQDGALLAERAKNARSLGRPLAAYEIAELAWTAQEWLPLSPDEKAPGRAQLVELLDRYNVPWR